MLVDPGEREEVISGGLLRGGALLVLSLLLHSALLYFSPGLLQEVDSPSEEKLITLELLNSIRERIRREHAETGGESAQATVSHEVPEMGLPVMGGRLARLAADGVEDLSRVRAIRSAIYSLWEAGSPPEQGKALVLLHINANGHLVQTWVKALQGEQAFQEYMQSFFDALELPDSQGDELWLECEFVVK